MKIRTFKLRVIALRKIEATKETSKVSRSAIHETQNKVGDNILVDNLRCLWMPHGCFPYVAYLCKVNRLNLIKCPRRKND